MGMSLPAELEGRPVIVEGEIIGLPEVDADSTRFRIDVTGIRLGTQNWPSPGIVRLDWRNAPPDAVRSGERWRFPARLKRPHGFANPGSFDYELWLLQQRIRATGYVLADAGPRRLAAAGPSMGSLRAALGHRLDEVIGDHPLHGVVEALAIGDRSDISPAHWKVFFQTNTGHLIAISGLHIGLVAAAGFFLARRLWSLSASLVRRVAAPRVAAVASVLAAGGYCLLAGFEVPAQRTLIMIAVVAMSLCRARRVSAGDTLVTALLVVLLFDPLSVTAVGFWLSFVAVAILMYAMGEARARRERWRRVGAVHVVMAVGLTPLLALFFGQQPLVGPLANLVAVPWVSFIVVPLTLVGTFLCGPLLGWLGDPCLRGALLALDALWWFLAPMAGWTWASLPVPHPSPLVLGCAAFGVLIMLMPRGLPGRAAGLVWLAPLFLHVPPSPAMNDFEVSVLDVGQGLAAVVRTQSHTLVFDAGPAFGERFDTGALVVLPFLRHHGIRRIDRLVISHGDNDHIGGAPALLAGTAVADVLSSVPERIAHRRVAGCRRGQQWSWDGVAFEMLGPPPGFGGSDNDGSCVLRVSSLASGGSVLLTGDIEAVGEAQLLREAGRLPSDVVVAPHHGSRSSSSPAFVRAVRADYVIFPVGYRNRWRFPDASIVDRWQRAGARMLRTDRDGAVTCRFGVQVTHCQGYRDLNRRYWSHR
jgi:competence protein ComEC